MNLTKTIVETTDVTIDALTHDGRGIARVNGKVVFVEGALPTETVRLKQVKRGKRFNVAEVETVLTPAPDRVMPHCPHANTCGGCTLQHLSSTSQVAFKQKMLLEQLVHFGGVTPLSVLPPLTGKAFGYRRKARLGVRYVTKKGKVLVGFREKNTRYLADITACETLHPKVGHLITALQTFIGSLKALNTIPQIEVAVSDFEVALVFRHMEALAREDHAAFIAFAQQHQVRVYLQPRGPESIHQLWPTEDKPGLTYQLPEFNLNFSFRPTDFIQVNGEMNRLMVSKAIALLEVQPHDTVLDLFCGLGNFTLPLARKANYVVGIEGEATMTHQAAENAKQNAIDNVEFHVANLFEACGDASWAKKQYDKILLDPPRAGAAALMELIAKFNAQKIVYISCHPATQARDIGILVKQGYQLVSAGVMDMFPHTTHIESIALLVKKNKGD